MAFKPQHFLDNPFKISDTVNDALIAEMKTQHAPGSANAPGGRNMLKRWFGVGGKQPLQTMLVPAAGATGVTAEQYMNFLQTSFGGLDNPEIIHSKVASNNALIDAALANHAAGHTISDASKASYLTMYTEQKQALSEMEHVLAQARTASAQSLPDMINAVFRESSAVQATLGKLNGAAGAAHGAASAVTAGNAVTLANLGITGDQAHLFELKGAVGSQELHFKVANLANPGTSETIKIATVKGGDIASGAQILENVAVGEAHAKIGRVAATMAKGPIEFQKQVAESVGIMEKSVAASKTKLDEIGTKLLKQPSMFAPAVEKTAVAAAETMGAEVKNLETIISEKATKLGVVGEAAMAGEGEKALGFFGKILANAKANLNIAEVVKDGNKINAVERSTLGKGMVAAGAGAGAILVGYGLKDLGKAVGMVGPDVDESGKEIPADSSTLIKSVAELGAGAALAYFTLLKHGKAAGHVL